MIRWLVIILFIYLIVRLIRGPRRNRKSSIRFRFGDFNNNNHSGNRNNSRKQRLEEIEDAEFEDITDKVKKENNS